MSHSDATKVASVLDALSFQSLQGRLQQEGHGALVPDAMLFISDMSALAGATLAGENERVAALMDNQMRNNRARRLSAMQNANCDKQGKNGPNPASADMTAGAGQDGNGLAQPSAASDTSSPAQATHPATDQGGTRVKSEQANRKKQLKLSKATGSIVVTATQDHNLRGLLLVLFALVFVCALIPIVHYGMFLLRVAKRHRKTCRIPATLTVSILEFKGHITILGQLGCSFVPDTPPAEDDAALIGEGTFCSISANNRTISAKLLRPVKDSTGMQFSEPMEISTMNELFALSLIKPKPDLAGDAPGSDQPWRLGHRQLLPYTESSRT